VKPELSLRLAVKKSLRWLVHDFLRGAPNNTSDFKGLGNYVFS